ncbi:G-type lectin S-receptor-like serine/threonine-protein kinase At4g27290 [Lolium rigidum]|uniref:G-type lectin S-receptor-like serine/threonine-protein kinase At4g27290 n=1 Tax=Lolium rigidum TaxID=89674 RepID=UPI001F5DB092|nr:G-type lectin S-receptor-like serine/threonine-protein kinase At4g27290 [Lolium rigidum]
MVRTYTVSLRLTNFEQLSESKYPRQTHACSGSIYCPATPMTLQLSNKQRMPMYWLPVYAILLFLSWPVLLFASDHRLVPGKPLSPGSVLISQDGVFALGIFSTSSNHSYMGIWYNSIPEFTVVWVSNRAAPITDLSSANLAMTSGSNLVLSDSNGHVLWTTNNSISVLNSSISAEAMLDNSGNFILRSSATGSSAVLWQSFDHPTNTLLPGMNLRLSHKMHPLQHLVSWKGQQDPSPGEYSYGADPDNLLQRFIWHGSAPHWRSPVWTNYLLRVNYDMDGIKSSMYMALHHDGDEVYMSFGMLTGSFGVLLRMEIDYSGKVSILAWESNMSVWKALYTKNEEHECSIYGYCGPYGYCDNAEAVPGTCKCLDGFEPRDDKGWIALRFSQGCRRKEVLRCTTDGDGFLTIPGMKVPDKFIHVRNRSLDECKEECRSNCSCVAYAYSSMSNMDIDGDATRCLVWMGDLIDMEKFTQGGENLYVRANRLRGNQGRKNLWRRPTPGDTSPCNELADRKTEVPILSFIEISAATNNFSEFSILGRGGFGNVYKGTLEDGSEIAVKRLSAGSVQGVVEFKNEVVLIAKLQHRNLVKLQGFCIHKDEKLLIYEYLPNGSLDAFIFNDKRKSLLNWPARFKIIKGIARGLLYLHQDSRLMMIHRDLKAGNILLDAQMSPKISDFGTARIFGVIEHQEYTDRVVGTFGYMSPEYAMRGIVSVKSDVYSFGVLLLEIVSGLKIGTTGLTERSHNLIDYAWSLWKDGNMLNLVDSSIVEGCSLDEALRCIHIGLLSVQNNPNARPLMSWVVSSLDNEAMDLELMEYGKAM